jgi:hypothetical protein
MVSLWRRAAADAAVSPAVQSTGASRNVRPVGGPPATTSTVATAANAAALLELRHWLASRFNWHPT